MTSSPNLWMVLSSEWACVRRTWFASLFVLQLTTWTGSLMALGAPILLTDRSENEKRSSPGGSSLATRLGWAVAVSVSCTLNSPGSIVEEAVSASYHWQGLIP